MTYGSVCSGIEAASLAWSPLGWDAAWFAEVDPFANAVLAHRWPGVPNRADFTTIPTSTGPVDVLVGGTPCQSFSVAGRRRGLDDDRGNLALEFARLADRVSARWVVWENVPGVLSSSGGGDFARFLSELAGVDVSPPPSGWRNSGGVIAAPGYHSCAWRVLDARFFGVPQRRRRVFVVGHSGDWTRPVAVLSEPDGVPGHLAAGGEAVPDVAFSLTASVGRNSDGGRLGNEWNTNYVPMNEAYQCHGNNVGPMGTIRSGNAGLTGGVPFIVNAAESCAIQSHARPTETARCLDSTGSFANAQGGTVVSQPYNIIGLGQQGRNHAYATETSGYLQHKGLAASGNEAGTLVKQSMGVRRLTPRECERLMGMPDDYTLVPWRRGMAPDGPRYRAIGNSMAVPVVAWLGRRIMEVSA